jgi:hypothetical protein
MRETTATFTELAKIAELRWKDGNDIVVAVRDAGNGPAVDIREYVTRDAYADGDFDIIGKGRKGKQQKEPYVGPTRKGFWISAEMAADLADALAQASILASSSPEGGTDV